MGIEKGSKKQLTEREERMIKLIGERIQEIRIEQGYGSYENFAFKNNIPRMVMYRIEGGEVRDFQYSTLLKILDALNTPMTNFFKSVEERY